MCSVLTNTPLSDRPNYVEHIEKNDGKNFGCFAFGVVFDF